MPWNDTRPWLKDPATRFKTGPPDPAVLARLHDAHCHPSDDDSCTAELLRTVKTGHLVRCSVLHVETACSWLAHLCTSQ
jgi:hypothetical protein